MSFPINPSSLAAVLAALAGAARLRPLPTLTRIRKFQPFARARRYFEQGARECARRQGGQAWAEFKAADRVRRGLAPFRWVARNDGEAQAMVAAWRKANLGIGAVWEDV